MGQKIAKVGVKRQKGYLYYLTKSGDVACVKMARGGRGGGGKKIVAKVGVVRKDGYLYYIDRQGDVCQAKLNRGRKRAKRK